MHIQIIIYNYIHKEKLHYYTTIIRVNNNTFILYRVVRIVYNKNGVNYIRF